MFAVRQLITVLAFASLTSNAIGQFDPLDAEGYLTRGRQRYGNADWEKAIKDFTEVIRLDPKNTNGYLYRGCARSEQKEFKDAIDDFTEVIRLDPKNAYAFINRGNCWLLSGSYTKAAVDFTEGIRLDPKNAYAFTGRGSVRINQGDPDKAIEDLTEAIRLAPNLALAFRYRGIAWQHKREFDKSNQDFTEAIRFDPKDADAYANRAKNLAAAPDAKLRDGKKSLEDAKKACDLTGWKLGYPLEAYAAACAENANFDEAVKWQKKVLEDVAYMKIREKAARERLELYETKKPVRFTTNQNAAGKESP